MLVGSILKILILFILIICLAQSLSKLVNDEESDSDSDYLLNLNSINTNNIWAAGNDFQYQRPNDVHRTGSLPPSLPPPPLHQINQRNSVDSAALGQQKPNPNFPNGLSLPKNVCTVEELERGLLTNRIQNTPQNAPIEVPKPQFMPNFPLVSIFASPFVQNFSINIL